MDSDKSLFCISYLFVSPEPFVLLQVRNRAFFGCIPLDTY